MKSTVSWTISLAALVATPWLVFVSTAVALYLKNQTELYFRYDVLFDYGVYALVVFALGCILVFLARRWHALTPAVWGYLLIGPFFLLLQALRSFISNDLMLWSTGLPLLALYTFAVYQAHRRIALDKGLQVFSLIALAYIALDMAALAPAIGAGVDNAENSRRSETIAAGGARRPNIYHLVLDEYQTDMFELTLNEEVKAALSGFTWFSDARTVFGRTEMALPSVFSGQRYDFASPPIDYQIAALSSQSPLLSTLIGAGYNTNAVMHPVFDFAPDGFHKVSRHAQVRSQDHSAVKSVFFKLWLYSVVPEPLIARYLDPVDFDQLKHRNLLTLSAPLESYESMRNIIANEQYLRDHNRYEFIHLLIPHFPYVLGNDCTYELETKSSPAEQAHCATRLVIDFLDELKRLGRFRDALIVVQSDHGASFALVNDRLKGLGQNDKARFGPAWSNARSRTLLLIKPQGIGEELPFSESASKASLLDVAPTITGLLELPFNKATDGFNLYTDHEAIQQRQRYYHFYNKRGTRGRHFVQMTRFRIEESGLVDEGIVATGEFK